MAEDDATVKRFFASQPDPWRDAAFAAVTEREFEILAPRTGRGSIPDPQTARPHAAR
jgi:hypothetical protein